MTGVASKLRLRPGDRVLVINAPGPVELLLGELPEGVSLVGEPGRVVDAVLMFVRGRADVQAHLPTAAAAAVGDRILWLAYPKGGSGVATDINRDAVPELTRPFGLQPVSQVAIDHVWSALRLRPIEPPARR